jgi:hypothetical protein
MVIIDRIYYFHPDKYLLCEVSDFVQTKCSHLYLGYGLLITQKNEVCLHQNQKIWPKNANFWCFCCHFYWQKTLLKTSS